jgi:hypothetical protein
VSVSASPSGKCGRIGSSALRNSMNRVAWEVRTLSMAFCSWVVFAGSALSTAREN